jgi:hypothetical protein
MQAAADFNSASWTQAQKIVASLKAKSVANTPSYLNEKLTLWFPPADSSPFTTTSPDGSAFSGTFPPYPVAGAGPQVILAKTVDTGKLCVIRKMSIFNQGANPPDGSGNVVWRVLVNGAAVKGMNAMLSQYGAGLSPQDCQIIASDGDVIQVTVEVPAGKISPPGTTGARWDGYTCPLTEAVLSK